MSEAKRSLGCLPVLGILFLTVIVSVVSTVWFFNSELLTQRFKPVVLNLTEEQALSNKLEKVGLSELFVFDEARVAKPNATSLPMVSNEDLNPADDMAPEPYQEDLSKRHLTLSERELNAIVDAQSSMGDRLVIDLSNNLASAKMLMHLDPDFPFLGGKTLKLSTGLGISFQQDKPVIILKGVSIWGVPVPNAWLGGLKNVDLVEEFGNAPGFWKAFSEGIKHVAVKDGQLLIELKE